MQRARRGFPFPGDDRGGVVAALMYELDTIAAIATAPGPGAIGVVRISGPEARRLGEAVFRRIQPGAWTSHRLYRGRVCTADGTPLDEGLAVLMAAPHSYTGEDVLELHCHGSPIVLERVVGALLVAGARPARAGEFTKRAFLNGKLDLAQAEAVMALIQARTADGAEVAAAQLFGGLSAHLAEIRDALVRAKAHIEARIDFSDEEFSVDDAPLAQELTAARDQVAALLGTYARGELLRRGLRVTLAGRPNAGKSSLFNALLGSERAIVTPAPGTTRDVIEATADFDGVPVVLVDTAGLRESADMVERIGVERAEAAAALADVRLLVLDTSRPLTEQAALLRGGDIAVLNKIDVPGCWSAEDEGAVADRCTCVRVSATVPAGLEALRAAVLAHAGVQWADNVPMLTSARQRDALIKVHRSLAAALDALRAGLPVDLIAVDVQAALEHIGTVTGAVANEEVLDAIFAEFCIGK
ncbi:MAG: tRNA uridine-5-carboxymethylaminomethyl(34) synthesis GTPase MnmE [Candidatus Binatia bacterium]